MAEPSFSADAAPAPEPAGTPSSGRPSAALTPRLMEDFARAYLSDRRAERRWRILIRLLWLMLVAAIAWAMISQARPSATARGPHTALVEIRGEIASDSIASAEQLNAALRDAFADASAKAVVLRINSPGGSPVQAGLVNDEMRRLKTLHPKPLYAVCEEMCASAAYYIAVGADRIYVDKASVVGSIGVLMDGFGFTGTMDKLGVERRLMTAGANKGMLDPFSPLQEEHRELAQKMLDQVHQQFIATVKAGRGNRLKETPETFSGLFWNGETSVQQGLADQLGSLDFVAREVVKAEEVIDYTPRENVAERLAKRFGAALGAGVVRALRTLPNLQ